MLTIFIFQQREISNGYYCYRTILYRRDSFLFCLIIKFLQDKYKKQIQTARVYNSYLI
jgi:hypothetical protein